MSIGVTQTTSEMNKTLVTVQCKQTYNYSDNMLLTLKIEYNSTNNINNNRSNIICNSTNSANYSFEFECGSLFVLLVSWSQDCIVKEVNETLNCRGIITDRFYNNTHLIIPLYYIMLILQQKFLIMKIKDKLY